MDENKKFLILLLGVVALLMYTMNQTFKLILNPVGETSPEIIKKIHKVYLVGVNNVLALYIAFLIFSYGFLISVSFFEWIFILVNMALGLIMLVLSADAMKKLKDLPADEYKEYNTMLGVLVASSVVLLVIMMGWAIMKRRSGAQSQS